MVRETYRLTPDMKDAADALFLRMAESPVTLRQVYADSLGQAAVVWNIGSGGRDAASETDRLFREIMKDIDNTSATKAARAEHEKKNTC